MLLNQCLAISLSPIDGASRESDSGQEGEEVSQQVVRSRQHLKRIGISQATASQLYEQLVERNRELEDENNQDFELEAVFRRVEFAGFVVPSWLLISGTYDDLRQLKSSWARGRINAPPGLRIETIGKFPALKWRWFSSRFARA